MTAQDWYNFFGVIFILLAVPFLFVGAGFRIILWWQDRATSSWRKRVKRVMFGKRWEQL